MSHKKLRELFQSLIVIANLIPGLKQPWAEIRERLRRNWLRVRVETFPSERIEGYTSTYVYLLS